MNYEQYSKQRLDSLAQIQDWFKKNYKIDSFANCFYDNELKILRLYNDDEDEIYFKFVPIGTYNVKSKTWMWSWYENTSIEKSKKELLIVKEFGVFNNYEKLYKGFFLTDDHNGWELSSVCLEFFNSIGVYKVDIDDLEKYLLILNVLDEQSAEVIMFKQKKLIVKHMDIRDLHLYVSI